MSKQQQIRVNYAILCDDIRREDNGKLLSIGIYASDILLQRFPGVMSLSLLLHASVKKDIATALKIRYRAEFDNPEIPTYEARAGGDLQVMKSDGSDEVFIPVPQVPITVSGSGRLQIHYRLDGNRWKLLLSKGIKQSTS